MNLAQKLTNRPSNCLYLETCSNQIIFGKSLPTNLILIIMSHDLNLINSNYKTQLRPSSAITSHNQAHSYPFSTTLNPNLNQNHYSLNSPHLYFTSNSSKLLQTPSLQLNQAISQNHLALKNLIDMIDSRKTKNTINGLSFNKSKQYQRTNRFKRKPSEESKRKRNNFVEDLKEVKLKMNEIMRLIDIKIKENQLQHQNTYNLNDFDEIKQKLTVQQARLDIIQQDNVDNSLIFLPKMEDSNHFRQETNLAGDLRQLSKPPIIKEYKNNQTVDQQYLHLKYSFDKLNETHTYQDSKLEYKQKDQIAPTIMYNQLNSNNLVQFFTKQRKQEVHASILNSPSRMNQPYCLPQLTQPNIPHQLFPTQQPSQEIKAPSKRQVRFQKPMSLDNKIARTTYTPQINLRYNQPPINLRGTHVSTHLINHQDRFYNPNTFGRPISPLNIRAQPPILSRVPGQMLIQPPISHFSPPTHSLSLPFRSKQKAIIRQWDQESRPDLSFGLSSSRVSINRKAENGTNLKKTGKHSQKFSFIQHFANNPDARKKREESMIETGQAKQSIVEYGFPKTIPRQQSSQGLKNPFQQWNEKQKIQRHQREQEIIFNDNSMRTVLESSEHNNKNSIIHQNFIFQSSKSGSKPSNKINMHQTSILVSGSTYKKKKKGLEVSQRMNQTHYIMNH